MTVVHLRIAAAVVGLFALGWLSADMLWWRRRRRSRRAGIRMLYARYACRAGRSGPLSVMDGTAFTERPYLGARPEEVL